MIKLWEIAAEMGGKRRCEHTIPNLNFLPKSSILEKMLSSEFDFYHPILAGKFKNSKFLSNLNFKTKIRLLE